MTREIRRLYRPRDEMTLAGVCGGLGVYFGIDPVVVRLLWVGVTCLTGFVPGVVAYLIAWIIVPVEPPRPARTEQPAGETREPAT